MEESENSNPDRSLERLRMVERQVRRRGVNDERVLDAMMALPREHFVPEALSADAYKDRALPIGYDQTISQPYMVAYMTQQLGPRPSAKILEIGTGTGYQTAILARLADHIHSVDRIAELSRLAAVNLAAAGVTNVTLHVGDGTCGLPPHAPFDRILVTAGSPAVPQPLVDQLADGGVMILPIGSKDGQTLIRVQKEKKRTRETSLLACRFVKLIGTNAWGCESQ